MTSRLRVARIPVGRSGLNGSRNVSDIPNTSLIQADNISYVGGTIQKDGGIANFNASALSGTPNIVGGWDWNHDGNTQRSVIVTDDGDILKDSGTATYPVTLASGLTINSGDLATFAEGDKLAALDDRKLFICTGSNAVQVLAADGATTAALTTPPTDWSGANQPKFMLQHDGRMFGGGNENSPHLLYYSTTTDHQDFTGVGSGTISIFPGEGQKILGAVSRVGSIIVFKNKGIYQVDTRDPDLTKWRVYRITSALGIAGVRAYDQVEDDILYVDQNYDIRTIVTTDRFADFSSTSISDPQEINEWMRDNLDLANSGLWSVQWYPTKREVHISVTASGQTEPGSRLVIDINRQLLKWRYSPRPSCVSLWTREINGVEELMAGGNDGFIRRLDQETKQDEGVGFVSEFQTPFLDFSNEDERLETVRKNGKFLELVLEPAGDFSLEADIFWDNELTETVVFEAFGEGAVLGSFELGADVLGGEIVVSDKRRISGSGRRFSVKFRSGSSETDFSMAEAYLHYSLGSTML